MLKRVVLFVLALVVLSAVQGCHAGRIFLKGDRMTETRTIETTVYDDVVQIHIFFAGWPYFVVGYQEGAGFNCFPESFRYLADDLSPTGMAMVRGLRYEILKKDIRADSDLVIIGPDVNLQINAELLLTPGKQAGKTIQMESGHEDFSCVLMPNGIECVRRH